MDQQIIQKYNVPVPRYTSYPTANYFEDFTNEQYLQMVEASNAALNNHISFYIHVPFCRHLCHYCGCNSVAMAKDEHIAAYFKALHQEIDLLLPHIQKDRRISQIHYGGGSPSSMPLHYIKELNEHLLSSFDVIECPEIAIECHPGYLSNSDWEFLAQCGFTRYSLGIQDFNNKVLKAVNRRPSLLPIEEILTIIRTSGARVNFDFIYGLPQQTATSFAQTIEQAISFSPDRLVTFGYAHVPWLYKSQIILEKMGLPHHDEKLAMFQQANKLLKEAGYCHIGMDHFVKPDDDLQMAFENKTLHRNFQGYCPRRITAQVYALGVSGISQLDGAYAQNTKNIWAYIDNIQHGKLCIERGYALQPWQKIAREVIEAIMCNYQVVWKEIAHRLDITEEDVKASLHYDTDQLQEMANDGIIDIQTQGIFITKQGAPFVRNVAAALDKMMINTTKNFSKPL